MSSSRPGLAPGPNQGQSSQQAAQGHIHIPPTPPPRPTSRYRYAVVCASNMNRSMEGHKVLLHLGAHVESYGTGSAVRLPGPAIDKPNVYPFGTPYAHIKQDLLSKDQHLYYHNGLITMLDRNLAIKRAPQRWQERLANRNNVPLPEIVLTCEERVFDAVCDDLMAPIAHRISGAPPKPNARPVHVVNLEIRDTAADAAVGGQAMAAIFKALERAPDLDEDLAKALKHVSQSSSAASQFAVMHCVCYQ